MDCLLNKDWINTEQGAPYGINYYNYIKLLNIVQAAACGGVAAESCIYYHKKCII